MTIDEAIAHAREVADTCEYEASKYDMSDSYESHVAYQEGKCAEEHEQLAEWLEELKEYKATLLTPQMIEDLKKSEKQAHKIAIQNAMLVENLYKAIDDFSQSLKENLNPYYGNYGLDFSYEKMCEFIDMYAEQLKEGRENEYNI